MNCLINFVIKTRMNTKQEYMNFAKNINAANNPIEKNMICSQNTRFSDTINL